MTIELVRAWLFLAAMLFFGSFVHEDAAIFAGGYFVVEHNLPPVLAAVSLYVGVVLGDCAIYGLGRLARRSERLTRLLGSAVGQRSADWLSRRVVWLVVGGHLTPAILFPTLAAMGWTGIPFRRFAAAALLAATLYVPPMFIAVILFGNALTDRLKIWGWPVLTAGFIAVWLFRRRAAAVLRPGAQGGTREARSLAVHHGMPPLRDVDVKVPFSEKINPLIFYVPLALQWLWLGFRHGGQTLPSIANPSMEAGGLLGESKGACMALIGAGAQRWCARWRSVRTVSGADGSTESRAAILAAMQDAGLAFPVVVKPDIGWRGIGVRRLDCPDDLERYLAAFPLGETLMVQEFVAYDGEAGVFYARMPGEAEGRIFSLTFRYFPFVVGDGRSSLRELILENERSRWKAELHLGALARRLEEVPAEGRIVRLATVGSNRVGGLYVDGRAWITPAMNDRFDAIARSMPEFWFGRFDIRFASIERLQQGDDFRILEVNGAGSEAIHIWDPNFPLLEAYRALFQQQTLMFAIAAANRRRGYAPASLRELARCQQRQQRLLKLYPESN